MINYDDYDDVIKKASELGLRVKWISNGVLYVNSALQEWYIEPFEGKYVLRHKNTKGKNQTNHYHIQKTCKRKYYNNYCEALCKIKSHDNYRSIKNVRNRTMQLYDMIEHDNIPKMKII